MTITITARVSNAVPAGTEPTLEASIGYRYYVLAIVWLVLLFRFIDLQIISVLLESIRAEFKVTDTQLGLLSGTSFALLYGILGIPVAWMADKRSRRSIIAVCLALWSGMTALCALAAGFASLFIARMGVGIGEAGGQPPSYSLICDYFPVAKRSTVFAILNSSLGVGVFVGFLVGGWVNAKYGWRVAFLVVGAAGLIVAILVRLTVKEPRRGVFDRGATIERPGASIDTFHRLWSIRSYRQLVLASSIFTLGSVGSGIWNASFFIRVHHMSASQVAIWLACIYGAGGLIGAPIGGILADRLSRRADDNRWQAWVPAFATVLILPLSFFVYLWPNPIASLLVQVGITILMYAWGGPTYATIQNLAGPARRALAAAINQLIINIVAIGLGPLIVGVMSDYFRDHFADNSLRYSLLAIVTIAYIWAAGHFFTAARTLRQDLLAASSSVRA
jgi:MFS family permease